MHRPGAAGRRRARRIPGRGLSGARRSEPAPGLGLGHFRRCHQRSPDRGQRAAGAARQAARLLGAGQRAPHSRPFQICRTMAAGRFEPRLPQSATRWQRAPRRRPGLLHAEDAAALSLSARIDRGHQLVRYQAADRHAGEPRRLRSHQCGADALQRRRGQHPQRQLRLFRFDHAQDQARAHPGERRAAARVSSDRDRWRALLGRRARLQYAAAMGGRGRHASGYARIPGRPVERARRGAERPARRDGATKGDPVFEPDARQHGPVQEDPDRPQRAGQHHRQGPAGAPRQRGRQAAAVRRRSPRLPDRSPDLPVEELRRPVQGLRVLARQHERSLDGGIQRRHAHVAPSGGAAAPDGSHAACATFDLAVNGRE